MVLCPVFAHYFVNLFLVVGNLNLWFVSNLRLFICFVINVLSHVLEGRGIWRFANVFPYIVYYIDVFPIFLYIFLYIFSPVRQRNSHEYLVTSRQL